MRKILIFFMAIVALSATSSAFAAKRSIMELPLFERAVLIIKHFETLHKSRHWPYVGYGHQVQPGEPYHRGVQLTEKQADALLRKDLRKFCAMYSKYGKDSVLLGALAYNCGPGVVNKSSVLKKLKAGNRDIFKSYTSHCRYKGKFHKQLHQRRIMEIMILFQK
ncbi:glycoside hydrolase family protein [Duncaniella dubosii]|uniref:glycoside hydrolase family protein n=1 Tax=Duncaniella dubosii TaxID=2518971 RepID=UPI0023EFA0B7|nr:glycoside hydrolase family protein [Duncaniella dubosii]MCX4285377.1 glycoside hydrolase family protein [Duncaniella dubosii]